MGTPAIPRIAKSDLPAVTMDQMREVDRIMIEELHIELMQMMENAGRSLAWLALHRFEPARVLVLAGPGGNGGGGLVAARHLANWGVDVGVVLSRARSELSPVPSHQLDILERMSIPIDSAPAAADLYVDAVIGYSLEGNPRGRAAELIGWLAERSGPILSLDTPSGLDVTTGISSTPAVRATATLTLAAPKTGLLEAPGAGELYLADISVPPEVYKRFGMTMPTGVFRDGTVVRLI